MTTPHPETWIGYAQQLQITVFLCMNLLALLVFVFDLVCFGSCERSKGEIVTGEILLTALYQSVVHFGP